MLVEGLSSEIGYRLVVSHPVISESIDYKGMPSISRENGVSLAEWIPYGDIRTLIETKEPTIWLIDDLGQAPLSVQAALMQWIHKGSRTLNGQKLSDTVSIVACTNRRQDRAGVSGFLEPVKSRFVTIVELDVDHDEWAEWAMARGITQTLIAFLLYRPELLSKPDPNPDLRQSPSPRGWESVAELQAALEDLPRHILLEAMTGAVGEGPAAEYDGFLRVFHNLPDFDEILRNPKRARVPEEAQTLYALCGMLAMDVRIDTMDKVVTYAERLAVEFQVVLAKFMERLNPDVIETRAYVRWATSDLGLRRAAA
jgi:hypothetical protein